MNVNTNKYVEEDDTRFYTFNKNVICIYLKIF